MVYGSHIVTTWEAWNSTDQSHNINNVSAHADRMYTALHSMTEEGENPAN